MESPSLLLTSPLTSRLDDSGEPSLCIAVIGATGELARGKIFPALFALYYSGFLPEVQFNRFSWFFVYAFQRFTSYVET
jgi:glucose-6-phosphate 1-dehydrogenase